MMEGSQVKLDHILLKLQVSTQSDWPVAYVAQVDNDTSGDVPVAVLKLQVTVDPERAAQQNDSGTDEEVSSERALGGCHRGRGRGRSRVRSRCRH
ncbi:hypothetical protein CRG98_035402 [Punica granatum]|uniref:Uncharacterized protein n=1 Tax=Punica granatum TaxID=22663 RepID=A0A2I0IJM1_PUNGR|nr:hypothetical protein CRG98_035402 [Punica granatum]